jgi:uncharacterized membrane protein
MAVLPDIANPPCCIRLHFARPPPLSIVKSGICTIISPQASSGTSIAIHLFLNISSVLEVLVSKSPKRRLKTIVSIVLATLSYFAAIWSKSNGSFTPLPADFEWIAFLLLALLIPLYRYEGPSGSTGIS